MSSVAETETMIEAPGLAAAIADPDRLITEFCEWFREYAAENSVETYRAALRDLVRRMAIRDLRAVDGLVIERYRNRLFLEGLSESTRQMRGQSAPRKLFRWLVRRGHVPVDPMKDLPPMKVRFTKRIPVLTQAEVALLTFRSPPAPPPRRGRREPQEFFDRRLEGYSLIELRDRALLALVFDIPLRASEPGLLERNHYDEVRGEVDIVGAKWQSEPFSTVVLESTRQAMAVYLDALRRSRWSQSAALFPPLGVRRADSKRPASGIGPFAVRRIMAKRVALAGIQARGRRLSPHIFRYTRGTRWKQEGVPIEDISALLRHSTVVVTQRYVRLGPVKRMKRKADRASIFRRPNFEIPPA